MALFGGIEITGRPSLENVRKLDLLAMPMVRRMMQYGIAIDKEWFYDLSGRLEREMSVLRGDIVSYIPEEKLDEFISRSNLDSDTEYLPMNVDSGPQLARLLFDTLGIGKDRQLKLTKSGDRVSTGKKQLEILKRTHPIVQRILDYRERAKLKSTYSDKLPQIARLHPSGSCWCGIKHLAATWRVHTEFLSTRTGTGRFASKNPNLQNIPSRTGLGREIRKGFIPSPGTRFVACDFAQEEMRIGAHYSNDSNLIRIFELGIDPHNETAKRAFATDTPDYLTQRTPSRNVNFGVFYGLSGPGLYDLMAVTYATAQDKDPNLVMPDWLTVEWCNDFIRQWFEDLYPGVQAYLEQQYYRARRYGIVWTLFGRIRRVPETQSVHQHIRSAGLRQSGNLPIQGTGADLMKLAMGEVEENLVQLHQEGAWCWPLLTIHDELLTEVEEEWAPFVKDLMSSVMSNVMRDKDTDEWCCRVPLTADGKIMSRWEKG